MLEGINIKDYDVHHLRRSFGVVSQEPTLFNETVEWNIRYNMVEASDEQVRKAAKDSHLIALENKPRD